MPLVIVLLIVAYLYIQGLGSKAPAPKKCGGLGGVIKGAKGIAGTAAGGGTAGAAAAAGAEFLGGALCNVDLSDIGTGAKFLAEKALDGDKAIVHGAEFVGGKVWSGAEYVGGKAAAGVSAVGGAIGSGAKSVAEFGVGIVRNPLAGVQSLTSISTKTVTGTLSLATRATGALYNSLPAPLKIPVAPIYAVEKVTAKVATTVVKGASGVVTTGTRTLASGAKAATSAVSSGVSKVLGFF